MKPWLGDASSLADSIRHGDVRSADAVEASLDAIAASKLNAIAYLDAEGARQQAAEIDRRIAAGEDPGLLAGVPLLVKDLEHAKGMPTTHGSVVYKDNIVDYDSTHVGAAARGGRRDRRQVDGVGVRAGGVHGDEAARRDAQPVEPRTHAGRIVGRLGGRGVGRARAGGDGERRRRFDPHPGGVHGTRRHEGHVRAHPARAAARATARSRATGARWPAACATPRAGTTSRPATTRAMRSACRASTAGRTRLGTRDLRGLRVAVAARSRRGRARARGRARRRRRGGCAGRRDGHAARRRDDPLSGEGGGVAERRRAGAVQRPQGVLAGLPRRPDVRDPRRRWSSWSTTASGTPRRSTAFASS